MTPRHHIIQYRRKNDQPAGIVLRNAPLVIVGHGRTNYDADTNFAIANRSMQIMAAALGLGTCWLGFLRSATQHSRKIGRYLGIAADRKICSAIIVGYPKHEWAHLAPSR